MALFWNFVPLPPAPPVPTVSMLALRAPSTAFEAHTAPAVESQPQW